MKLTRLILPSDLPLSLAQDDFALSSERRL